LRGDRLSRDIEDELESHLDEAAAYGRDPAEARRALGPALQLREQSRDLRLIPWLDSLRADAVFGWRQLARRKVTSAAAIVSLALAIGSCTAAFRLIDALLLRPLPVAHTERLYRLGRRGIGPEGKAQSVEEWSYPLFQQMRSVAQAQAELIAVGPSEPTDVTFASDREMEKAYVQFVSGGMFASFGLRPAAGRLLTGNDDLHPSAHPYAVLSDDYWSRRFARDPSIIGRGFHLENTVYEIVGVCAPPFTGTETGTVTDIFVPSMMHPFAGRSDASFAHVTALVNPGVALETLRDRLQATSLAFETERAKGFRGLSQQRIANFLNQSLYLESASAGASGMQRNLRLPLLALAVLVALVLLIACVNVANLLTAQAAARTREMALRVSIGAGRWRLVQLVLVESAMLAGLAAAGGAAFAWWSAPFVVARINPPDNPARLSLPADWRVLAFTLVLTAAVTLLFGLAPALRAAAITPANALKGGHDPRWRGRLMHSLIAVQAAFCFVVLFVAGLFVTTFDRLVSQPTGFSAARILVLNTVAARPVSPALWDQATERLRAFPGVETAALADWPLLNGNSRNNLIAVDGAPPGEILAYFRYITPGWLEAMRIPLVNGRDFRPEDTSPGAAIVNQAFADAFFNGADPVGRFFDRSTANMRYRIVGLVRDIRYRNPREAVLPVAFVPLHAIDSAGRLRPIAEGTFVVRTASANPLALASALRREIPSARPELRVSNVHTQAAINQRHTVRERLLAALAVFFGGVALLLAGVGLYGVLDYSVLQRRREIGIRMALGAPPSDIARGVTADVFVMVLFGAIFGLGLGAGLVGYVAALLYQVKPTDVAVLAPPAFAILAAALAAAVPAVVRAIRINPVKALRAE
jgi:predicted permease